MHKENTKLNLFHFNPIPSTPTKKYRETKTNARTCTSLASLTTTTQGPLFLSMIPRLYPTFWCKDNNNTDKLFDSRIRYIHAFHKANRSWQHNGIGTLLYMSQTGRWLNQSCYIYLQMIYTRKPKNKIDSLQIVQKTLSRRTDGT